MLHLIFQKLHEEKKKEWAKKKNEPEQGLLKLGDFFWP